MVAQPLPELPPEISELRALALDLRWTWSHEGDALWEQVDAELWQRTRNPWSVLQGLSAQRLQQLAGDRDFCDRLKAFAVTRQGYLEQPAWYGTTHGTSALKGVAYLSMEFGLGAALPLYAGGLGVLAGDFLKTASDLGVPVIGVGLLFQEGYFRQIIDAEGMQHELYPYNEPAMLPIEAVALDGGWLRIPLELPGRVVQLRVWRATIGRTRLYLLDSNDPLNSPVDRGITAKLYGSGGELRLMQEIALGVGGWRVIETLHEGLEVCHMNEGHAAFAVVERARHLAATARLDFFQALWATRAGNVFTTHTSVGAGFDRFPVPLVRKYLSYIVGQARNGAALVDEILKLGRCEAGNADEPFNMAWLAMRGSARCLAVSRLHRETSRGVFQALFPRRPVHEVPVELHHQRRPHSDLELDRGRSIVDRGLRQGEVAFPGWRPWLADRLRDATRSCGRCAARGAIAWWAWRAAISPAICVGGASIRRPCGWPTTPWIRTC